MADDKHKSVVARLGSKGQKYTDPLQWIFGDKYTDKLEKGADMGNKYFSKINEPAAKLDKKINPLRQNVDIVDESSSWVEDKPVDAAAIAAAAIFGGGAIAGGMGGGGGAAAGGGSTATSTAGTASGMGVGGGAAAGGGTATASTAAGSGVTTGTTAGTSGGASAAQYARLGSMAANNMSGGMNQQQQAYSIQDQEKICWNCGTPNPPEATTCSNCGAYI